MSFVFSKSACAYLWLFAAVLGIGLAQNGPKNSKPRVPIGLRPTSSGTDMCSSCLAPPQPENGEWQLNERFCNYTLQQCHNIPENFMIQVGSYLVYSCELPYRLEGNANVYCTANGIWSDIPRCIEVKCKSLNSASRMMIDRISHKEIEGDVDLWTVVKMACRPGYKKDTIAFPFTQGERVNCRGEGVWEVKPMECLPVCGLTPESEMPFATRATNASINNLPWHASLYLSNGTHKNFICGATIIRENLLLTSALCIYDETSEDRTVDSEKLFVMTGNSFLDYDSPLHDPEIVKNATVIRVFMNCDFEGIAGNYSSDIALVELQEPFVLSPTLVPACLDLADDSEKFLQTGVAGRSPGVVKTDTEASSGILQTLTLPFISESQYNADSAKKFKDRVPFSSDKFVTGTTKGSEICGGGIVFRKNGRWQIMGIQSTGSEHVAGNREAQKTCSQISYSIYTRTSVYVEWIFDHINFPLYDEPFKGCWKPSADLEEGSSLPLQSHIFPKPDDFFCLAPSQPENGEWRFHGHPCEDNMGCEIPELTKLKPGSLLIYNCASGYRASGNTDVFCGSTGKLSPIPDCIPVSCDPLNSISTVASCTRFREFVSCDSPVPAETQAVVSCRDGYKKDSVFVATRRETVTCTEKGKWQPDPIRCVPVCGVAINPQTPFAINGVPAKVSDFPWHATLYMETTTSKGILKNFQCGATIIQANFLLTAAHCVYDERTKNTVDPKKLFVMTGNTFRDWDSPVHDPRVVRKGLVKKVYKHSKYYGLTGNYVSDIALLELQKPFNFSGILLPACLDVGESGGRILEAGALGRVAGFGRTATGSSSGILQTVTAPYVPYNECKSSKNALENEYLIGNDKFCAGYNNGTAVCDGDSGGGLVFRKNDLWYVMGIVSVGIGVDLNNGERTCDRYSYTLYTKVTTYMDWIQDVISSSEQFES